MRGRAASTCLAVFLLTIRSLTSLPTTSPVFTVPNMTVSRQERYKEEREKRANSKGLSQYLDKSKNKYISQEDPWVKPGTPIQRPVPEGGHVKLVIFGAGFGGLCAAARALQEGSASSPKDILVVDYAGGYGGTWWHNRYPGLMCDVESYIYLPLLEEVGYMPKRKYAGGEEIRKYSDMIATKFGLQDRAMFQTRGKSLTWKDGRWECAVTAKPKGQDEFEAKFTADYVVISSGGFTDPKIPDLPGLDEFQGKMLHTGRWNYEITGGTYENPVLSGLEGKRVAIIGTGATAIQAVPATARYAKELYVFQRTASAVDVRNNYDTDPEVWKTKIATKKGWQAERSINFQAFTEGIDDLPEVNMVDDGMSNMPTLAGSWGGSEKVKPENTENYVSSMEELDATRSERVRQRTIDIVKDPKTAEGLQAWYPGWCKRPTFHDEYLPAFNQPNVHLVDTNGKGVEGLSANGIKQGSKEYPVDVIIWSTGYGSPLTESLAGKAGITVTGKNGQNMEERFKAGQLMSFHGLIAQHFPNLFYTGLLQAGVGVNQTQRLDEQSLHIAHIIREAEQKKGGAAPAVGGGRTVIEPSETACEDWANQCASHAHKLATMGTCLPSYLNNEGETQRMSEEEQAAAARGAIWGQGFLDYARVLREWRESGRLEGLEVGGA